MDKNNDMRVYKISKWKEAPDSIKDLHSAISEISDKHSLIMDLEWVLNEADAEIYALNKLLARVLDDYNELEAKYQEACGMISQYEEENRTLREQRRKLVNSNNKVAENNYNLRRERDRHIDLLDKLRLELEKKGICCEWNEAALKWNLYDNANICEYCKKHFEEELRIREKEKDEKDKLIEELNQTARHECEELHEKIEALEKEKIDLEDLLVNQKCLEAKARVNASTASIYKSEIKQIIELAKSYGVIIHDDRKDAKSDDAINISMCGHYYILDGHNKEESKDIQKLKDKIEALEKENKDLKDTLEKDGDFGKNIGKCVADSIREGCDKGVYELHPCARIDIHVEETNSIPIDMPFGRYAIPRISVIFNNTQTEMERDTAQHECEELNEKIKELAKENIDLKTTLALCERDANMARELCHTIAFNAERARNKTP